MKPAKLPFITVISFIIIFIGCLAPTPEEEDAELGISETDFEVVRSESEWRKILTPQQFHILREKGTERAFSGKYHDNKTKGLYVCAGCGEELFHSDAKFDSGTGWPSFWEPVSEENVLTKPDNNLFMRRTEVLCSRCGGHLGHVFDDGPRPTGLRYCINSAALNFKGGMENPYSL